MKDDQWEAVHEVFVKTRDLCEQMYQAQSDWGEQQAGEPDDTELSEMVRVRSDIRTQLEFLRVKLAESLTERESYLVMFPIVVYFDELIQSRYIKGGQTWPPLQRELYQIDDGGILFYDTLEDILRKPQTLPFIYEVYYFCIDHGFRGRYNDDPVKINEYKKKLAEKIPVKEAADSNITAEQVIRIRTYGSPWWYYAGAGVLVIAFYILLKLYATYYGGSI